MNYTIIAKSVKTKDGKNSNFSSRVFSISSQNQLTGSALKAEINKVFPNPGAPVVITTDSLLVGTVAVAPTALITEKVVFYNATVSDAPGASASASLAAKAPGK